MELFVGISAYLLMPIYAVVFIYSLISAIQKIVKKETLGAATFWAAISFALMMWTITGTMILTAM